MSNSVRLFSQRDIFKLFVPLMAELALTLMVGVIDSIMVSGVSEAAVSGVSLIDTIFQLLIYIFAAFGTGGAVVAGQYLGAKKNTEACDTANQLVWFSAIISVGIMLLIYLVRPILLGHVFGTLSSEVYHHANNYLLVVALSIPALSIYESGAAIFRTMGNSKITMFLAALMNIINFLGNTVLIYACKLEVTGSAISTVISRYIAAAIMIGLLMGSNHILHIKKTLSYHPNKFLIRRILSIGIPNGVENGLFQAGKIILASLVASFGTSSIAANAICQTISSIQVIPGSAMQLVATTIIARCIGAQDEKQAIYYNRIMIIMSYVVLLLFCGILWFLLPIILPWYHLSNETVILTRQMLFVHTLAAMLIWSLSFVLPASMRAAGDVRFIMIMSIISMWIFRIGAAYFLSYPLKFGALGIWIAMLCDWMFRAIIFSFRWHSGKWKNRKII